MRVAVTRPYLDGKPVNELRQLELAITPHGFLKEALAAKDAKAIKIQTTAPRTSGFRSTVGG